MRYLIKTILLITLFSCTKEKNKIAIVYPSKLKFTVTFNNDTSYYVMNGDLSSNSDTGSIFKKTDLTNNGYNLSYGFRANDTSGSNISFYILTPGLATGFYTTDITAPVNGLILGTLWIYPYLTGGLTGREHSYGLSSNGDFLTLQVTKIHDGLADGLFNGRLSAVNYALPNQTILYLSISNGEFSDVKVIN
jgi:hypothetical protein